MKQLYSIFFVSLLTVSSVLAQDPSIDRWVDSGDETIADVPASATGRVVITKNYSNAAGSGFNELLRLKVNHNATDYMSFRNGTTGGGFVPAVFSYNEKGSGSSLMLIGVTNNGNDYGNDALINFNARKYDDNTLTTGGRGIVNRPLFSWNNYSTVYMQMLANGNLGIGTQAAQAQLHTTGTVRFEGLPNTTGDFVVMADTRGNLSRLGLPVGSALASINTSTVNNLPRINNNGTLIASQVTDDGVGVGIGGVPMPGAKLTLYGTISLMSDERQKTNIVRLEHALDKVSALNGYYYNWRNGNPGTQVGFMAQEVEQVLPEVVSQNSEGTRFVNYDGLVPLLTEAIKEQRQLLEVQSRQIKELQREVRSLKQKK